MLDKIWLFLNQNLISEIIGSLVISGLLISYFNNMKETKKINTLQNKILEEFRTECSSNIKVLKNLDFSEPLINNVLSIILSPSLILHTNPEITISLSALNNQIKMYNQIFLNREFFLEKNNLKDFRDLAKLGSKILDESIIKFANEIEEQFFWLNEETFFQKQKFKLFVWWYKDLC